MHNKVINNKPILLFITKLVVQDGAKQTVVETLLIKLYTVVAKSKL